MEQWTGSKFGKEYVKAVFNLYSEYVMWIARLNEAQAGIKTAGRNINNLRYADDTIIMAESKEELKSLLMKVKENEKAGLKLNIQKMKIMASGPITLWQIDGEKWKQWQTLFSWAPKSLWMVTAAMKLKDNFSLEEELCQTFIAFWKQRHHFADKGPFSQSYGFSSFQVWMWKLDNKEGWVPKLWYFWKFWTRVLRVLIWQGYQTCQS